MTSDAAPTVHCSRCGREGHAAGTGRPWFLPHEWQGTLSEAVCPGCQYAEWHPHCSSLVDVDGERVDLSAIPREERALERLSRCEYIDLTVSWIDDADWPQAWRCPECGGTGFEGVHRDYQQSGLRGTSFTIDADTDDD
jgi:hypothetical protein